MFTELKSVRDVWKKMPTERHARLFLENAIWGNDRFCPHCGSLGLHMQRSASPRAAILRMNRPVFGEFYLKYRCPS